jgi:ssDNA-specific exonuclease RecJ
MNFTDKIIALEDEMKNYIISKVQDGETLELISRKELDSLEDDEILWDMPIVDLSNKYNESCTFAIVSIDRKGESIDLKGYGIGEHFKQFYIFSPYELTANELGSVADYLK